MLLIAFLISGINKPCVFARNKPVNENNKLYQIVHFLSHDSLEGRYPGSKGEQLAAKFIADEFSNANLKPIGKSYRQPFSFSIDSQMISSAGNIVAKLDVGAKQNIVIGAHYDHLGWGGRYSKEPFKHAIHNGADDNASGVAILLALAQYFSQHQQLKYNLIFVAYSGEEEGLYGSAYFLKSNIIDTLSIVCNINFDMLGSLHPVNPIVSIEGIAQFPAWEKVIGSISHPQFNIRQAPEISEGGSDHYNFWQHNIPVLFFTTGITEHYHKSSDDAARINFIGLQSILQYLQQVITAINQSDVFE